MRRILRAFLGADLLLMRLNMVLAGAVLLAMVGIAGTGVVCRFLLHAALSWGEEANMYLFVWLACVGAAVGFRQGLHPQVDALVALSPPVVRRASPVLSAVAIGVLGALLLSYGGQIVSLMGDETGSAVPYSMAYPYAAIPYAGACLVVHAAALLIDGPPHLSELPGLPRPSVVGDGL